MFNINWPSNTKDITDAIREAIGRNVDFYTVASSYECPTCGYNPVTEAALDPLCITCSGFGIIEELEATQVLAHVTWGGMDNLGWVTGGQLFQGDCRIQIEYTVSNNNLVDNARFIIVDGKEMKVDDKRYRGVPSINRILVDLYERDKDNE